MSSEIKTSNTATYQGNEVDPIEISPVELMSEDPYRGCFDDTEDEIKERFSFIPNGSNESQP